MLMRVRDRAGQQEVAHLLGDLQRDVLLRLGRRGAEMRRADDVLAAPNSGIVRRRLRREHVERGAGDVAGFERVRQRRLVDQAAARAVDDAHAASSSSPAPRA